MRPGCVPQKRLNMGTKANAAFSLSALSPEGSGCERGPAQAHRVKNLVGEGPAQRPRQTQAEPESPVSFHDAELRISYSEPHAREKS